MANQEVQNVLNEQDYACDYCDYVALTKKKASLTSHMRRMHPEIIICKFIIIIFYF